MQRLVSLPSTTIVRDLGVKITGEGADWRHGCHWM